VEKFVAKAEAEATAAADWAKKVPTMNFDEAKNAVKKVEAAKLEADIAAAQAKSAAGNYNFNELIAKAETAAQKASTSVADAGKELLKIEEEHREKEWQKKLAELKRKAAEAKPKAVDIFGELIKKGFNALRHIPSYIQFGTAAFQVAWNGANPIARNNLRPRLKSPPIDAAEIIFKTSVEFSISKPLKDGNDWSARVSYEIFDGRGSNIQFSLWEYPTANVTKHTFDILLEQYPERLIDSLTQNKGNYEVLFVFENLHLEQRHNSAYEDVHADLISADIVVKGTETPVVHLYPETKLAGPVLVEPEPNPQPGSQGDNAPPNNKAQQIQKVVDEFLVMNPPPVAEVSTILGVFQNKVMPQIQNGVNGGRAALLIAPAFLFHGKQQQPMEPFGIDEFLKLPKDKQFDTIYRLVCGSGNIANPHPNDRNTFNALRRFSTRILEEEKKKQPRPPAAPAVVPAAEAERTDGGK
jgi:hypothetical protein